MLTFDAANSNKARANLARCRLLAELTRVQRQLLVLPPGQLEARIDLIRQAHELRRQLAPEQ